MRHSALLTATAWVALCHEPAFAQDQAAAAADQGPATSGPQADETEAPAGEILVTARRRVERLTDVPVSITAIQGEDLAARGITRVDELQVSTPGFKTVPTAGRRTIVQYELRGINSIESLITQDTAVGIYVNDVYRARPTGTNQGFYDVANVQVLFGPQGTLFGRNSTGGAVLINTNPPTNDFEGSLEAGYGNFDRYQLTGVLNLPLSDALQVRVAGQRVKSDGYQTNVTTGNKLGGIDDYAGRVSVRYGAGTSIENLLVGSFFRGNEQATPIILYGYRASTVPNQYGQVPALAAFGFNPLMLAALANQQALGPYRVALDGVGATLPGIPSLVGRTGFLNDFGRLTATDPFERARNYSVSNTSTIELNDSLTLKNIFGYNYTKLNAATDLDGTPLKLIDTYYRTTNKQISNELQLQGRSPRFDWVLGGLFFRERGVDEQPSISFINNFQTTRLLGINRSIGIFAQGTYKLTDQLSFTAGGRYTFDRRKVTYSDFVQFTGVGALLVNNGGFGADLNPPTSTCFLQPAFITIAPCATARSKSFKEPSWTFSLDYKPTPDSLLYVAHRHGYRAGGFNARIAAGTSLAQQLSLASPFGPEKIDDVEVGAKGTFQLGEVVVRPRVAAYYNWYKGIQKQTSILGPQGGITIISNVGDARVKGLEAELGITLVRGMDIDLFYGFVDGHYKDYQRPGVAAGVTIPRVPFATAKHSGGAALTMTPIDDEETGQISLTANFSFRSHYFGDNSLPNLDPEARVPAQQNLDLSLTWTDIAGSRFSATGWVKNALDDVHYLGVIDLAPSFGFTAAYVAPPRTYGLTLKYEFGDR